METMYFLLETVNLLRAVGRVALRNVFLGALLALCLGLVGCDSAGPEGSTAINGTVTDDQGYGKTAANVEGAVVTAASVDAGGSLRSHGGEATTNVEGQFMIEVEQPSRIVVVQAAKTDFASRALVYVDAAAAGQVNAMPMTVESKAEADVYVAAMQGNDADAVTVADVAAYVSKQVALEIEADNTTAAEIAASLRSGAQAEERYMKDNEVEDAQISEGKNREEASFLALQAGLSASAGATAQADAVAAFEEAYTQAYVNAGVSVDTRAQALQVARTIILDLALSGSNVSSSAKFAVRKQMDLLTALAKSAAVKASFEAQSAAQARLDALQQARVELIAQLRAADTGAELEAALEAYKAAVKEELAAELSVNANVMADAEEAVLTEKGVLDLVLNGTLSVTVAVTAYSTFYADAGAAAAAAMNTAAGSKASFGGEVLALLLVE